MQRVLGKDIRVGDVIGVVADRLEIIRLKPYPEEAIIFEESSRLRADWIGAQIAEFDDGTTTCILKNQEYRISRKSKRNAA